MLVFHDSNCKKRDLPSVHSIFFYIFNQKNLAIIENFSPYTDQKLLQSIKKRDEKAFAVLYDRYYLPLCKKAFQRIPFIHKVEEIVQDVFVTTWSKSASLEDDGNIRAYLYAVLRNKILHELRTEKSRALCKARLELMVSQQETTYSVHELDIREDEQEIHRIINKLPPQCQKVFSLSRFEHLSYKEIAQYMNLSVTTVEKHITKALSILRSKMKEQYRL